jgi:hypothetical protein
MKSHLFISVVFLLIIHGCASGPTATSMVATSHVPLNMKPSGILVVSPVSGGEETNPMLFSKIDDLSFREALYQSLVNSGLFEKTLLEGDGDYRLNAEIVSQEVKSGINMAATLMVHYELYEKGKDNVVWSENIFSQYEALFEESYYGVKRAQLANEGVVKKNFNQLIEKLASFLGGSR